MYGLLRCYPRTQNCGFYASIWSTVRLKVPGARFLRERGSCWLTNLGRNPFATGRLKRFLACAHASRCLGPELVNDTKKGRKLSACQLITGSLPYESDSRLLQKYAGGHSLRLRSGLPAVAIRKEEKKRMENSASRTAMLNASVARCVWSAHAGRAQRSNGGVPTKAFQSFSICATISTGGSGSRLAASSSTVGIASCAFT